VAADGGSNLELGSVMKMTIISDGELTQLLSKTSRNHKVILLLNRFVPFLRFALRKT
jgi:membrane protein DedA with SNARE-associated domain